MGNVGVAVVGAGYWGPNLVRNLQTCQDTDLRWVCDLSLDRAKTVVGSNTNVRATSDLRDVLGDGGVDAVVVATPVNTHFEIALECLEAGRHVLVEKPLAPSVADGEKLVGTAADRGLVLMCDHTYCYTPIVSRVHELSHSGTLGSIQYLDSVRINLGLIQPDVDVFWDLAPHDLSILDFILPAESRPEAVAAHGADPLGTGHACVGYLTMALGGGAIAHVHVNWLSPTKIRTMVVGGSAKMVVWNDLDPQERLRMYDKGVELSGPLDPSARRDTLISYRTGDMIAPALPEVEALQEVVREFAGSITEGRTPRTDGRAGLRVLHILEAATRSLDNGGGMQPLDALAEL